MLQKGQAESDKTFVGHSTAFSFEEALGDAVRQAMESMGHVADAMIEFEVRGVRGRTGGIAGFRDLWVEIALATPPLPPQPRPDEPPEYTTLALGEEGGAEPPPDPEGPHTTKQVAEEGGAEPDTDPGTMTTLALGEEGG